MILLLVSVIFVAGCSSSSSKYNSPTTQQATLDGWTKLCNLNNKCVDYQKQCADAFRNKDAFITYDTYKKSVTYGQSSLWISSYKGNVCQKWQDWVMAAASNTDVPKEFIWQWAEDANLIKTFDQAIAERETFTEKAIQCQQCSGGASLYTARCLNQTFYERCVEGVNGCYEWRNWTCQTGKICTGSGECIVDKGLLVNYTWSVNDVGVRGFTDFGTWVVNVSDDYVRAYSKPNVSGDYVKIDYVNNILLKNSTTFEFDYDTTKTTSESYNYFDIGYYNDQHKSISAGGKQGIYHIKFIFLNNRTINAEISEPDGNVGKTSIVLDEKDEIRFRITPYYRGSQFDFEYKNFKIS